MLGRTAKNNRIQLCGGRNPAAAELTVGFASRSCSSLKRHMKRGTEVGAAVPLHLQELYTYPVKAVPGWSAAALGCWYSSRHCSCRLCVHLGTPSTAALPQPSLCPQAQLGLNSSHLLLHLLTQSKALLCGSLNSHQVLQVLQEQALADSIPREGTTWGTLVRIQPLLHIKRTSLQPPPHV